MALGGYRIKWRLIANQPERVHPLLCGDLDQLDVDVDLDDVVMWGESVL